MIIARGVGQRSGALRTDTLVGVRVGSAMDSHVSTTCLMLDRSRFYDSKVPRVRAPRPRSVEGEGEGKEPMRAVETFHLHLTAFEEVDTGPGNEVVDDFRHEHFATERLARDS